MKWQINELATRFKEYTAAYGPAYAELADGSCRAPVLGFNRFDILHNGKPTIGF